MVDAIPDFIENIYKIGSNIPHFRKMVMVDTIPDFLCKNGSNIPDFLCNSSNNTLKQSGPGFAALKFGIFCHKLFS